MRPSRGTAVVMLPKAPESMPLVLTTSYSRLFSLFGSKDCHSCDRTASLRIGGVLEHNPHYYTINTILVLLLYCTVFQLYR